MRTTPLGAPLALLAALAALARSPRSLLGLLLALPAILGCGPDVVIDQVALAARKPKTVAVLPFAHDAAAISDRAALRTAAVRAAFARRFREHPYLHLKAQAVDAAVRKAGLEGKPLPVGDELAALGRALGVDALVIGRVTDHTNLQGGVIYRQSLDAEVRLVDARDGRELARAEHSVASTGGLLLGSGQSLEAIEATLDNASDQGFLRLVDGLAKELARALPPPPERPTPTPPQLHDVRILAGAGRSLAAGDVVEVEARGTPGLQAVLDLGLERAEIPMVEETSGRYRGRYRVLQGDRFQAAVSVHASDRFGTGAAMTLRDAPVVADALPASAPRGLEAERTAGGRVRLRWEPSSAVVRVFGLDPRGVPRVLGDVAGAAETTVAGGFARYEVATIVAGGALGRLAGVDVETPSPTAPVEPARRGSDGLAAAASGPSAQPPAREEGGVR